MKTAYWARFFKEVDGGYSADVPDLPGCLTKGGSVEETYGFLINQAIPLWLEDQPWPAARCVDEILAIPCCNMASMPLLVRVPIGEISERSIDTWAFWPSQIEALKRKSAAH